MEKKLFALDYDGTLLDSRRFYLNFYNTLSKIFGTPSWKSQEEFGNWCEGTPQENMNKLGLDGISREVAVGLHNILYERAKHSIGLYPGVGKTLEGLHRDSFIAILSNNDGSIILDKLEQFELTPYVDKIVSSESMGDKLKPHPFGLELLMNHFGTNPSSTFFVGDMHIDCLTAINTKVPFVWASYGYHPKERIHGEIHYVLEKPEDMLMVV
jgi:phosphoglycolate phosphatase-like HAD superfamily hydrolase